jgi:hypothetical protein
VDEVLPAPKLFTLGLQHVLVMYAGAVAVPLIIGRALKLEPADVAFLISADLFVCGLATLIQSLGATQWFGIKLPVMMGVTFAAVGPMVAMANANGGPEGARAIFGAIIAAGMISILIAPFVSRMLRFFPPVVTGTIILVIGVPDADRHQLDLRQPGRPDRAAARRPAHAEWLKAVTERHRRRHRAGVPPLPEKLAPPRRSTTRLCAGRQHRPSRRSCWLAILLIARFGKGFVANIAVLLGIVIGAVIAAALGMMSFAKVARPPGSHWSRRSTSACRPSTWC